MTLTKIPLHNDDMSIWKSLNPESVISAVERVVGTRLTNLCLPRNSYINRVYEVEMGTKERLIAKFYRPHRWTQDMILGEHAFLQKCANLDIPVIPPISYENKTVFEFDGILFALFPKKGGRVVDELNEDLWKETGRLLGRVHNVGQTLSNPERVLWRPSVATQTHFETLQTQNVIPEEYKPIFKQAVSSFIQKADPLFTGEMQLIHGDAHFGNIIYRPGESLYLVDFDDCCVGPIAQDLWMLLPDEPSACANEIRWFIDGYTTFRPFPNSQLDLIPALKIMRQIHFSAWCAIQKNEPHFQYHFPDWGNTPYWNQLVKDILGYGVSL